MFIKEEDAIKSPWGWIRHRREIAEAIEILEYALEDYDEGAGLAFEDVDEKLQDIKEFFDKVCGWE